MRTLAFFALGLGSVLFACGGGGGASPVISQLSIATSSVARGMTASGTLHVTDADGLSGLKLELAFDGPSPVTTTVDVGGASGALKESDVPFVFGLTNAASAGSYTLGLTAIDGTSLRSNTLSKMIEIQ